MGKVSQHYLDEQELEFELELSYMEWRRTGLQKAIEIELDKNERDSDESLSAKNRIITDSPLNNHNYTPREVLI